MISKIRIFLDSMNHDYAVCMTGDFNLPDIRWDEGIVNCPINSTNQAYLIQKLFLDLFADNNLQWIIGDDVKIRKRQVLKSFQEATLDEILLS